MQRSKATLSLIIVFTLFGTYSQLNAQGVPAELEITTPEEDFYPSSYDPDNVYQTPGDGNTGVENSRVYINGEEINVLLEASGGTPPYSWSFATLMRGMEIVQEGGSSFLRGSVRHRLPVDMWENYNLRITATDSSAVPQSATLTLDIEIIDPLRMDAEAGSENGIAAAAEQTIETPIGMIRGGNLLGGLETTQIFAALHGIGISNLLTSTISVEGQTRERVLVIDQAPAQFIRNEPYQFRAYFWHPYFDFGYYPPNNPPISLDGRPLNRTLIEYDIPVYITEAFELSTTTLPEAIVGEPYSPVDIEVSGGVVGDEITTLTADNLPPGLTLAFEAGDDTGQISGIPEQEGSYTVTISASNNYGQSSTIDLELNVVRRLSAYVENIPNAVAGQTYELGLSAVGGQAPYTFESDSLPEGLNIVERADGWFIIGVPRTASSTPYLINMRVTDSTMPIAESFEFSFELSVLPTELIILNGSLPLAITGEAYSVELRNIGGVPPFTWSMDGAPESLELDEDDTTQVWSLTGVLTEAAIGSHTIDLTCQDSAIPAQRVLTRLALTVSSQAQAGLSIDTSFLPVFRNDEEYPPFRLLASAGTPPYSWAQSLGLPYGFEIREEEGEWFFVKDEEVPAVTGVYNIQLVAADSSTPVERRSVVLPLIVFAPEAEELPSTNLPQDISSQLLTNAAAGSVGCALSSGSSGLLGLTLLLLLAICLIRGGLLRVQKRRALLPR